MNPPGPGAGSAGVPVVALFIPADVLSKSDGEAADYFDRQLATAVKNDQAHQVFTVLAMWTKMTYCTRRVIGCVGAGDDSTIAVLSGGG